MSEQIDDPDDASFREIDATADALRREVEHPSAGVDARGGRTAVTQG